MAPDRSEGDGMSFVGKSPAQFVNVDNIHVDKDQRLTGTSAQAGLRRITRKAPQ
jgi:hypothetical protein